MIRSRYVKLGIVLLLSLSLNLLMAAFLAYAQAPIALDSNPCEIANGNSTESLDLSKKSINGTITIYEHKRFKGRKLNITLHSNDEGKLQTLGRLRNDIMSSLTWDVQEDVQFRFYEHSDGTGRKYTRGGGSGRDSDTHNNDFKDAASAYRWFKIEPEPPTDYYAEIPQAFFRQIFDSFILPQIVGSKAYISERTRLVRINHQLVKVIYSLKADVPGWDPKAELTLDVLISFENQKLSIKIIDVRTKVDSKWWQEALSFGLQEFIDSIISMALLIALPDLEGKGEEVEIPCALDAFFVEGNLTRIYFETSIDAAAIEYLFFEEFPKGFDGSLWFYEEENCKGSIKGALTDNAGQIVNFKDTSGFTNDEARSLRLVNVRDEARILVFDSSSSSRKKGWMEIMVKKNIISRCVGSFEKNIRNNAYIEATYHDEGKLDGKVSAVIVR